MLLTVFFFVTVASTSLVQAEDAHRTARVPQRSHVQYGQRNGLKEAHQRTPRQHDQGGSRQAVAQPAVPPKQPPAEPFYQYRPYSAVPSHIKQLLIDAYTPQVPYVNPHAFFYGINGIVPTPSASQGISQDTASAAQSKAYRPASEPPGIVYRTAHAPPTHQPTPRLNRVPQQSGIKYKNDVQPRYNSHRQEQAKRSPAIDSQSQAQEHNQDYNNYNGPAEIQQLLQFQAQIPYNVLANQILFQPKKPFVPQPLPADLIKQSRSYPSKIYYIKADGEIFDNPPAREIHGGSMNFNQP